MKRQPQKNDPIKQHFVPTVYLRNFCDQQGHVHIYDLQTMIPRHCIPEQTAFEKHLYTVVHNGHKDFGIEKAFCDLEGTYATHLRTIESGFYNQVTSNDYKDILHFMAFLYARNPSKLKIAYEIEHKLQTFLVNSLQTPASDSVQHGAMSMMVTVAETMFTELTFEGDWLFIVAPPNAEFITTDDPMDNMVFLPLSKKVLLWRVTEGIDDLRKKGNVLNASAEWVNEINTTIATTAKRLLYGSSVEVLKPHIPR